MKKITVGGMSCMHCVKAVTKALEGIDGVTGVKVDLEKGEASYEEVKPVDETVVREKLEKAGYKVG